MFKNCALPVAPEVQDEEYNKHSKGISGVNHATPEAVNEAVNSIAPLLQDLAQRLRSKFEKDKREDGLLPCEFPTAEKGALTNPSGSGGQVGELLALVFSEGVIPEMPFMGRNDQLRCLMHDRFGQPEEVEDTDERLLIRLLWRRWGRPDKQVQPPGTQHLEVSLPKYKTYSDVHSWDPGEFEARMALIEAQEEPTLDGIVEGDALTGYASLSIERRFPRCVEQWTIRCNELLQEYYAALDGSWVPIFSKVRIYAEDGTWTYGPVEQVHDWDGTPATRWDRIRNISIERSQTPWVPAVRCVAVCEPLKVRMITVGNALVTLFSAWWQKRVHKLLQRYACFKLLGRSPTTQEVDQIRDFAIRLPGELLGYGSSDFSGASNGTPKLYRELLMDWVNSCLPPEWRRIPEICNGNHWVRYPKMFTTAPDTLQTTGTLMGERTSFPILCLMVLGAHVTAIRRCYGNRPSFWRIIQGVVVNGDDKLSYTTRWVEDVFWQVCNGLQFKESVGKSYWHPVYANINSQSYSSFETGYSVKTGYFASGLFFGQKKLATDEFVPSEVVTTILDSCWNAFMEHDVMSTFIHRWRCELRTQLAGRNLFIPVVLGGCGHRRPQDLVNTRLRGTETIVIHRTPYKVRVTDEQQEVASELYWSDPRIWVRPPVRLNKPDLQLHRECFDTRGVPTFWDMSWLDTNEAVGLSDQTRADREVLEDVKLQSNLRIPKLSKDLLLFRATRSTLPRQCQHTWRLIRRGIYNSSLRGLRKGARQLFVEDVGRYVDHNVLLPPRSSVLAHRISDALPPYQWRLSELGYGPAFYKVWKERRALA